VTQLIPSVLARLVSTVLRLYQAVVSPLLPARCRFVPSCSEYAVQALHRHSCLHAAWLVLRRVGRCHPWEPGGYDPVP
jgi:putative membrane protein insertion efficiency factor